MRWIAESGRSWLVVGSLTIVLAVVETSSEMLGRESAGVSITRPEFVRCAVVQSYESEE
jgi:hypothetical protein